MIDRSWARATVAAGLSLGVALAAASAAQASGRGRDLPELLVSRAHYVGDAGLITPGVTTLPTGPVAIADGSFAHVWDNVSVDENFGVTAPIYLDRITPYGRPAGSIAVPTSQLTTSFSSKSELGLNLSTGRSAVTFMGYLAEPNTLDASNANTPGVIDPSNPDTQQVYRAVAQLDGHGRLQVTATNAYSGDNGRAAILDERANRYYAAGNSNNGSGTSVPGLIFGTGAQLITPRSTPGTPTPVGGFSVTQLPGNTKADKLGKDTNFSAVTIHDNVVYDAKGSGGNGIDTLYFVDTTGTACPHGVGLPAPVAKLPTTPDPVDPLTGQAAGNMCVLAGFPTALAKSITTPETGPAGNSTAFGGMWFANSSTLYVADAGNGTDTYADGSYTAAAAQNLAGIQKWSLADGTWTYDYTLNAGLGLGTPYTVKGLPSGINSITGRPWTPAVDGIRNLTGTTDAYGHVTLYGVTSTIGGVSDYAASPNKIVTITDTLPATTPPATEHFRTLRTAAAGDVYRGISLAPQSHR